MDKPTSCAMYVDGDGVPFWLVEQAVRDVRQRCDSVTIRAYKDWTDPGNQRLMYSLWGLDVDLAQVTPHAGLSNGTDIAIAVDAVNTLHLAPTDAVALVGNDGDFSTLARFLRSAGAQVLGYASRDASVALAQQCDHFIRYDATDRAPIAARPTRSMEELIIGAVERCAAHDGWAGLDKLGYDLRSTHGLQAKDTGAKSWSTYFRTHPGFVCRRRRNGHTSVRLVDRPASDARDRRLSA